MAKKSKKSVAKRVVRTAKSVAGLEGSFFGQATSPTLRPLGMDTVMSAKDGASPRSPVNISAGLVERVRVVATSIFTRSVDGTVSATGSKTPLGRSAHPEIRTALIATMSIVATLRNKEPNSAFTHRTHVDCRPQGPDKRCRRITMLKVVGNTGKSPTE